MAEQTAKMYVPTSELKACMRVSVRPNEPLREVLDVMLLTSDGVRRVTFSDPVPGRTISKSFAATELHEVHLTLDEVVAEHNRLSREETAAFERGLDLGKQRTKMAALARSLGRRV